MSSLFRENPVTVLWPLDLQIADVHELGWRVAFWFAEGETA